MQNMTPFQREDSPTDNARLIAILAGGKSLRMGRDKAQMFWRGFPLLEYLCREAYKSSARVVVAGRAKPENWPLENVSFLPDETPHLGPLGGLESALRFARANSFERVLAIACDMPLLDFGALSWLFEEAGKHVSQHGLAVLRESEIEPLFSVYTTRVLPLVENCLRENRRSLRGLIGSGDFAKIEAPPEIARKLLNLNTPEEWRDLQQKKI
jgi:molybdopterin-guanine dinucleotide biosynthesis protein A